MANDSTELTFVRCPSCRSLVPAVSSRCRMCGATLDTSQRVDEGDKGEKKQSRVRQRTMSVSGSDVAALTEGLREDAGIEDEAAVSATEPEEAETGDPKVESPSDEGVVDPLSAYIEEVTVEDSAPEEVKPEVKPVAISAKPKEMPVSEPKPESHIETHSHGKPGEGGEFGEAPHSHEEQKEEMQAAPAPKEKESPVQTPPPPAADKPRVVVESGRRPGKGGLSFGRGRFEDGQSRENQQRDPQKEAPYKDESNRENSQRDRNHNRQFDKRDGRSDRQEDRNQSRDNEHSQRDNRDVRENRGRHSDAESHERAAGPVVESVGKRPSGSGRLYGWLVSYSDPSGVATELREGKFFVTHSSTKSRDLVLADPSVSVPHALVTAGGGDGLLVQDLLSERGIFLRRRQGGAYQRIQDQVKIEHGDWLRFGDVEFLVVLVPNK